IVAGMTLTTDTNSPPVLVTGGNLTLRNDVIEESADFNNAAVFITGGTADLGTSNSAGGNTFRISGDGHAIQNTTSNVVDAVGNTYEFDVAPVVLSINRLTPSGSYI